MISIFHTELLEEVEFNETLQMEIGVAVVKLINLLV